MDKIRQKLKGRNIEGRALPSVLLTVFLDALGVGILIPIYTLLVLPGPQQVIPAGWTLNSGYIMVGWLVAIYSFCTFLAAPILGQLSDRYGRKRVLAISLAGTAIGYVLFAVGIITKNLPLMFASRALDGITGGNIAVARAVVGDISTAKTRTRNFGLIGAMFGLGFILGPYLGGKLAVSGAHLIAVGSIKLLTTPSWFKASTPFFFAAIMAGINALLAVFVLPETLKVRDAVRLRWNQSLVNIRKAISLPGLRTVFPSVFLFSGGFAFFTTFFGFNLAARLGFKPNNIADFFSYFGLWIVIVQVLLIPFLAKRFKDYQVLRVGYIGVSLAVLTLFIPHNTTQLLLIVPVIPLFVGMVFANSVSLVSSVAGPKIQGEAMGINSSVEALAQAIPAALSGYIAAVAVGLPIIVASITIGLGGIMLMRLFKPAYVKPGGNDYV